MTDKKTFLECMFNDLNDISDGTNEDVLAELQECGIDVEKAKQSFLETIKKGKQIYKCDSCGAKKIRSMNTSDRGWIYLCLRCGNEM